MNKFRAKPAVVDGIKFHSTGEARRWAELNLLLKAGKIERLERQVKYDFPVNGQVVASYIADFTYRNLPDHELVVEDFKSAATAKLPAFVIKKNLMKAIYGINILITGLKPAVKLKRAA